MFIKILRCTACFSIFLAGISLSGCSDNKEKETPANPDAALLEIMGVKEKKPAHEPGGNGMQLKMEIATPDFDRSLPEPEVKQAKRKESSLDF